MTENISPITLSKAEACTFLGVSKPQFDDWRRKGILPAPIEGTHRWSRKSLRRCIEGVEDETTDAADAALESWLDSQAS